MASTSFHRAASPFFQSLTAAVATAGADSAAEAGEITKLSRHRAIYGAGTVSQVVDLVPADYRSALRPLLLRVEENQGKHLRISATVSKWERVRASGAYPPHIRQSAPKLEQTKEYVESASGVERRAELTKVYDTYLSALYQAELAAKKDEKRFVGEWLTAKNLFEEADALLTPVFQKLLASRKRATFVDNPGNGVDPVTYEDDPLVRALHQEVREDVLPLCLRVISIVTEAFERTAQKADKKREIHRDLDVEMADVNAASGSSASIEELAKKRAAEIAKAEVKKALAAAGVGKKKAPQKAKYDSGKKKDGKASGGPVSLYDLPAYVPPPLIGAYKRSGGKVPLTEMKFKRKTVSTQKSTAERQAEASSSRGPKKADYKGKGRAK
ncbi:hypothetical protein C8Q72DRAFT_892483 [Fomitopsis betulina]|nr:hypothetical protein C8Q72DRAFT_892483 [Fomitopsis betulina]